MKREQRRTPRYTFIASAELIEQKTDVRIATRVSELSLNGCYLDMMNPFPQGTLVLVKIAASVAVASLSWYLFERPILRLKSSFASRNHPAAGSSPN